MPIFAQDTDKIVNKIISELNRNSSFSAFQPGQKLRAIIDAFAIELGEAYQVFDFNIASSLISGASGQFLDSIGDLYGVKRKSAQSVISSAATETIKFYAPSGKTFGDLNSGQNIVIPAGTIIQTGPQAARPTRYFVKASTTLPSGSSAFFVTVESQQKGELATVGENSLTSHNFTNYLDVANNSLRVVNVKSITYAQNDESDNDFKYRIINSFTTNEAANQTALRLAALSIPGVSDAIIKEFAYGAGTCELIIVGQSAKVHNVIIEAVQEKVNQVKAMGTSVIVRGPREIGVELEVKLNFVDEITEDIKTATRTRVSENLKYFFDSTELGKTITFQQILQVILSTDSRISKVGGPNGIFNYIYLYRPSFVSNETYRRKFPISNEVIQLEKDEKLLTEFSIINPIVIL